ncbi:hypothetical protein PMm318_A31410 [Pseudomonas moorei]
MRHHFFVVQDRAGNQVREKGHEKRIVYKVILFCFATVAVDQKSNLRKGVKAYTEW